MNLKHLLFSFFYLCIYSLSLGQDDLFLYSDPDQGKDFDIDFEGGIDLEDAIQLGARHNSDLRNAFYRWRASVEKIQSVKGLDDPEFSFKVFIDEIETRVGPQSHSFSIGQKFPFPGKLREKANLQSAIAHQRYAEVQKAKLELFFEIKDVYFEYWFLHKKILVTETNKSLLERFEGVAQSKYKSGLTRNQDLLKAQVELGKLENELLTLEDYRAPIMARLNALLNRPILSSIGWPEEIDHQILDLHENEFIAKFHKNNPDLMVALERIEAAKRKVRLARLDYLPDFSIAFNYIRVDKGPLDVLDNGQDATALNFKINVPIWFGKQKAQMNEARSLEKAAIEKNNQLIKDLEAKISLIYFKIKDAQRQIELYRNALIPKAEQSLKASETAYSAGDVDFLNLIDSERTLLSFRLSYYQAIRNYEQRLAELEMIIGETLKNEK